MTAALDLVVVGGGPVGLAMAIRARMAGLSALVLEAGSPPFDRACGEGLLPPGRAALHAMGIDLAGAPHRVLAGIRFVDGASVVEARFPRPAAGVRRTVLHDLLRDRLEQLGGGFTSGARAALTGDGVVVAADQSYRARYVVAADGRNSGIRRAAAFEAVVRRRRRVGLRRHYRVAPWTDHVEVHWGRAGEAYVTPVADDCVGVAVLTSDARPGYDALLEEFPFIASRLKGAAPGSRIKGGTGFGTRVRCPIRGGLVLVGDAAGSLDPITGEGLSLGFQQAEALVSAVAAGELDRYVAAWRRSLATPKRLEAGLLLLSRLGSSRRVLFRAPGAGRIMAAILRVASETPCYTASEGCHKGER